MAHETHTAGHATAEDQYAATPPEAAYEHTDANIWIIVRFMVWLGIAAAIIHVGLALLFNVFVEQRVERVDPRYPLAAAEGRREPPEPRLQRFPREDILRFRTAEESRLQNYGWIDKPGGTVHIPIQDAMRLTLERGLLEARPQSAAPDPSLMPSDSSGGRTMERRRQ